jgi:hypothetical protein
VTDLEQTLRGELRDHAAGLPAQEVTFAHVPTVRAVDGLVAKLRSTDDGHETWGFFEDFANTPHVN